MAKAKTAKKEPSATGRAEKPGKPRESEPECGCSVIVNCEPAREPERVCVPCCAPPAKEIARFEVYMSRLRVLENREAAGKAELMITGYANGQCAVFPGNGLWVQLHKKWGWRIINKRIANVTFEKGATRVVSVMADAIEADTFAAGSWEMGSGCCGFLTLKSGQQVGAEYVNVDLHRVKDINAGTVSAKIEIEFMAFEVTP